MADTDLLDHVPRFDAASAEALARQYFGSSGTAHELPSERDQNFLIDGAGDRAAIVLKIANAREPRAVLVAQQRAIEHVAPRPSLLPRVIPATNGERIVVATAPDGRQHMAWAITHLPGVPLARVGHRSPALLADLGVAAGRMSAALADFNDDAIDRDFYWDLANGRRIVTELRPLIADAELGATIDLLMRAIDYHTAPHLGALRQSAIHGDLNDHNVLVSSSDVSSVAEQCVTGIVDFGDMVRGWTVGDLAIATAYAMLDAPDLLAAAGHVTRGFHSVFPLTEPELAALWGLIALRLCTSACVAAHQERARPDNAYLAVSQSAIRRLLPRLATIPFGLAEASLREACGVTPVPAAVKVEHWLRANSAALAPVLAIDPRTEPCVVLDLSVGSPLVSGDPRERTEPHLTRAIDGVMRAAGVRVAIGRYDEPRLLYTSSIFSAGAGTFDERRTIHLGLDLFADAGTSVHAPLSGIVHDFADLDGPLDYGPVIVLRHEVDGIGFFSLYGHLSRESVGNVRIGDAVAAGDRIGALGTAAVNGGWTPHLHLQLMTDLLALGTAFPGVAAPSQRAAWTSLCPDPNLLVGVPTDRFPADSPPLADALTTRRERVGPNLSVAYRRPLRIVRGWMQYLYDDEGRQYIDAYNNVPHVGHCHPRVVRAAAAQMSVLNTNTRYLNDLLTEYAGRLTSTLPAPLTVCWFVSSASEANELALRLARAYTGRRDTIVLDAAYHGNTTSLIDLSPYKHGGPGGSGAPDWVHVAPQPDDYRGSFRRDDPFASRMYARQVTSIVESLVARGRAPAAFIAETCPSVGGQIILPEGYLADVYRSVRSAGGVCIADEVQTGLGRMGTHLWAFEAHGVVPDIVVMGKPLGNGHPIGAVVTTPAIASAFDNGMEYFSTFGGNTVSCAVGLAVLDVLRDEGLQAHALRVGERMLVGLRALAEEHEVIGDVRGSGFFLGVELVTDRATRAPAGPAAAAVVERMREEGVLLGTDGPFHNVLKIRPPMPFDEADADRLVATLGRVLAELAAG